MFVPPDEELAPTGTYGWWHQVRGRCIQGGAGVTGKVVLDGVAFQLGSHTPLPAGLTINVGGAMAAWMQKDRDGFSGYEGIY